MFLFRVRSILARVKGAEIYGYKAMPNKSHLLMMENNFSWWTMVKLDVHLIFAFPGPDVLDFLTEVHWWIQFSRWWCYREMQSNYCFWTPFCWFWLWTVRLKYSPYYSKVNRRIHVPAVGKGLRRAATTTSQIPFWIGEIIAKNK